VSTHIRNLIDRGEGQQLDFKFEISDSRKIARTLVAFANTDGGTLLVGVKDNGIIAGVRSDEEYFMVEGAASMYCRPEVIFSTREWTIDGKLVLEVTVKKSEQRPHYAPDKDGNYKVFVRVDDQNLLANRVLLQVWRHRKQGSAVKIRYREQEELLMKYLREKGPITLSGFTKIAGIPRFMAERILVNFILLGIIKMEITEKQTTYQLINDKA